MKKINQVNKTDLSLTGDWPVTFEQVKDAQLRDMLKATPAQRLAHG